MSGLWTILVECQYLPADRDDSIRATRRVGQWHKQILLSCNWLIISKMTFC